MFSVVFLVIGIFVGWLISSRKETQTTLPAGVHMMGDGQMMSNGSMMGMDGAMCGMMAGLAGKTGDAFDEAFSKEMIMHHQGAVAMAEAALKNAKHSEIKTMANAIISAQTGEINQMKAWLKEWYGQDYKDNN